MLNQVILVGRVDSLEEVVVDNGTNAVVIYFDTGYEVLQVFTRDEIAVTALEHLMKGSLIAIKAHLHMSPDGLIVVADRLSQLDGKGI